MPDETPTPDETPRAAPAVRAGGTLDLSTGPAAPPPPPPAPLPPAPDDPSVRAGKTLNLSTGRAPSGKPRTPSVNAVLGSGPVIRETLDLSTNKPPVARAEPAAGAAPSEPRSRRGGPKKGPRGGGAPGGGAKRSGGQGSSRDVAPPSASESLADLLSPEMLAKLRGG